MILVNKALEQIHVRTGNPGCLAYIEVLRSKEWLNMSLPTNRKTSIVYRLLVVVRWS